MRRALRSFPNVKVCLCCDRVYVPNRSHQVYCGPACKQAAYRLRKRRRAKS